jgi:hypothetical protein
MLGRAQGMYPSTSLVDHPPQSHTLISGDEYAMNFRRGSAISASEIPPEPKMAA